MATEAGFRPHIDQENSQVKNMKGETGRSFVAAKSFQSSNAPLTTPRRVLGDVGNTIQTGTTKGRKGLTLKSNKPCGKTPLASKIFQDHTGTPSTKGQSLLHQISSAGLKQSNKQKVTSHIKTKTKLKVKSQEPSQKEGMHPFSDQEGLLPRPNYVSTILKNVGSLYHGCMFQPNSVSDSELDNNTFSFLHFEKERRPSKEPCLINDFLPFEEDLGSLNQDFCSSTFPEIELPPVDIFT